MDIKKYEERRRKLLAEKMELLRKSEQLNQQELDEKIIGKIEKSDAFFAELERQKQAKMEKQYERAKKSDENFGPRM